MSNREFHYVVKYIEKENRWEVDVDTTIAFFNDTAVYDAKEGEWTSFSDDEHLKKTYIKHEDELAEIVVSFNDLLESEEQDA